MIVPSATIFRPALPYPEVALRLLVCPLPSVLLFLLWEFGQTAFIGGSGAFGTALALFSIAVALVAILAGTPLYFLFKARNWSAWWSFVLAGALPPPLLYLLLANPFAFEGTIGATAGSCLMIDNGALTACGWAGYAGQLCEFGLFGGFAGFVYWMLLRLRRRPPAE